MTRGHYWKLNFSFCVGGMFSWKFLALLGKGEFIFNCITDWRVWFVNGFVNWLLNCFVNGLNIKKRRWEGSELPSTDSEIIFWVGIALSWSYRVGHSSFLPLGVMFEEIVVEEDVRFTIGDGSTCRSRIEVSIDSIRRFFRFKKQYRFYGLHMLLISCIQYIPYNKGGTRLDFFLWKPSFHSRYVSQS